MSQADSLAALAALKGGPTETIEVHDKLVLLVQEPGGDTYYKAVAIASEGGDFLISLTEALLCVVAINGTPETRPTRREMVEALAKRITRPGMAALNNWYLRKTQPELMQIADETPELLNDKAAVAARLNEMRGDQIKKSPETR